jgi:SAM-dependent methyltransferase
MTQLNIECTFCGCPKAYKVFNITDIFEKSRQMHICYECKTWFLHPVPDSSELQSAYSNIYYGNSDKKFTQGFIEKTIDFYRNKRATYIYSLTGGKGRVLDIGCGNGRFLYFLSKMGPYEIYGSELEGNAASRAKLIPEIHLNIGRFQDTNYPEDFYSAITLFHVFEHLQEPKKVLDKINRLLKKDGFLVLSFPNIRSLQAYILKSNWLHFDPPRHLFLPDYKVFIEHMKNSGYVFVRKKFFSPEQNPVGAVQGLFNVMFKKRDLLFELFKGNKSYAYGTGKSVLGFQKALFWVLMPVFIMGDVFESLLGMGATIELTFKKQ